MSDYFGALLRSAGAAGATAPAPSVTAAATAAATATATAARADDILEQDVAVEAGPSAERMPAPASTASSPLPTTAPAARSAGVADEAPAQPAGVVPLLPATPGAMADALATPTPQAPSPRNEATTLTHPLVRAALRWVAADAQAQPSRPESARPTDSVAPTHAAARPENARTAQAEKGFAAWPPGRGVVAEPAPPRAVREAGASELTPRPAPRAQRHDGAAERVTARSTTAAARGIDLHIGTIHVAVDAPPPRTVLQPPTPAPTAPRAQAQQSERSGLSRSRLPRL